MFISVQVYCCNHHFSLYRNWNKNKLKKKKKELPQKNPCSGSNADAEIRSLCESFTFKARSRSEYSHACFTCCLEFLACPNFYLTGSFTYTFVL